MLNDKIIPNIDEIDLTKIDWNVLTIKQFHDIEIKLLAKHNDNKKIAKKAKIKEKKLTRSSGMVIVKIHDKNYSIKDIIYQRLKNLKSQKSKEKLIDEIISNHNPIVDL